MRKEEMIAYLTKVLFDSNNVFREQNGYKPLALPRDKNTELSWSNQPLIKALEHHAEYLQRALAPYMD